MQKYFYMPVTGTINLLLNANLVVSIDQISTTQTAFYYTGAAAADLVTITHGADASGVAMQNFFVAALRTLMATGYTNVAPLLAPPSAVSTVAWA